MKLSLVILAVPMLANAALIAPICSSITTLVVPSGCPSVFTSVPIKTSSTSTTKTSSSIKTSTTKTSTTKTTSSTKTSSTTKPTETCAPGTCGTFVITNSPLCGPLAVCTCAFDVNGKSVCVQDSYCTAPTCTSNAECGAGNVCWSNNCCGTNICTPIGTQCGVVGLAPLANVVKKGKSGVS